MFTSGLPSQQGLYDPVNEHDNCGFGFVAHIKNRKSHEIVQNGLTILDNLTHRGAAGADPLTGDGAGILIQIPDRFYREECASLGFELPQPGNYGVGMIYLPQDPTARAACEREIEHLIKEEGQLKRCLWEQDSGYPGFLLVPVRLKGPKFTGEM